MLSKINKWTVFVLQEDNRLYITKYCRNGLFDNQSFCFCFVCCCYCFFVFIITSSPNWNAGCVDCNVTYRFWNTSLPCDRIFRTSLNLVLKKKHKTKINQREHVKGEVRKGIWGLFSLLCWAGKRRAYVVVVACTGHCILVSVDEISSKHIIKNQVKLCHHLPEASTTNWHFEVPWRIWPRTLWAKRL